MDCAQTIRWVKSRKLKAASAFNWRTPRSLSRSFEILPQASAGPAAAGRAEGQSLVFGEEGLPEAARLLLADLIRFQIAAMSGGIRIGVTRRRGITLHRRIRERLGGLTENGIEVGILVPADVVNEKVSLPASGRLGRRLEFKRYLVSGAHDRVAVVGCHQQFAHV